MTSRLIPSADGRCTHLHSTLAAHVGGLPRWLAAPIARFLAAQVKYQIPYDYLEQLLEREARPVPAAGLAAAGA